MSKIVDPDFMLSLARGLDVLRLFERRQSLTAAEAARLTGLSRSSAGRCLHTLAVLGHASEELGRYRLAPGLLPLACGFVTSTPLASHAQAVVNALRDHLRETVSVGVLDPIDRGRIIYIARAERNQVMAAPLMVGSTLPSHCTSIGRVLLAGLGTDQRDEWLAAAPLERRTSATIIDPQLLGDEIGTVAEQGWSLVEEELAQALRSLAVPVRDGHRNFVAALNVATFSHAHSRAELLQSYLPELLAAAAQIERAI
jgi:IclR family pca regulon transcriptional regulator